MNSLMKPQIRQHIVVNTSDQQDKAMLNQELNVETSERLATMLAQFSLEEVNISPELIAQLTDREITRGDYSAAKRFIMEASENKGGLFIDLLFPDKLLEHLYGANFLLADLLSDILTDWEYDKRNTLGRYTK